MRQFSARKIGFDGWNRDEAMMTQPAFSAGALRTKFSAMLIAIGWMIFACSPVRASVTFTCTVTANGINFGTYNPLSTGADTAAGSYLVTCNAVGSGSATVAGTLSMNTGSSGKFSTRTLVSGASKLNYNIYLTPSYTQILGDGTSGTFQESASGTVTAGQVYQVGGSFYGMMPSGQDVAPGSYADTIIITVAY